MPSAAIESQGTVFEIETGSPAAFVEVKEVLSFTGLDGQASEIDVTSLGSPAKERLMGLQDWGSWQMDVLYLHNDAGQTAMRAAKASRAKHNFRLTLSDNETVAFAGFVTTAPMSGSVDDAVRRSFTVLITGDVTFS